MADEEEFVVSVEGESGDVIVGEEDASAVLKKQYDDLLADNKRRKDSEEAANRRAADERAAADRARQDAAAARAETSVSQTGAIDAGISAANAEASQAEADYAACMEKGDFAAAAKAQRRIASAEAKIVRLDEAKSDLESRKSSSGVEDQPQARRAGDPLEEHISKFTAPTASWLREHRDWLIDPRKNARLTSAHHVAVAQGLEPDSTEYFEHVEKTLGLRDAPEARNGSGNGQTRTATRLPAPPVAPVNGGAGSHSSGASDNRSNQVYLTKGEKSSATDGTLVWNYNDPSGKGKFKKGDPIGIQEMARRKLEMQKRGLYDKNNIEA